MARCCRRPGPPARARAHPVSFTPDKRDPDPALAPAQSFFSVVELIDRVADDFGYSHGEVIGDGREARMIDARSVIVRILRERGWSFPQIGRAIGGRDHSTIINMWVKRDIYARRNADVLESFNRHRRKKASEGVGG
jgi:hypothetical protein